MSQSQKQDSAVPTSSSSYSGVVTNGEKKSQERLQMIDTMKAPIIQMGKSAEKFDEYNRPKGKRADNESEEKKITREVMLDEHSRPKGQKKKQTNDDTVLL
ncbi:MAG: hypothetical protein ACJ72Q_04845 [Nitrososphaeraceae archaeon]